MNIMYDTGQISSERLARIVKYSLTLKTFLALALFFVSWQSDKMISAAKSSEAMVHKHQLVFYEAALSTRRLFGVVKTSPQNYQLLTHLQNKLAEDASAADEIVKQIEQVAMRKTGARIVDQMGSVNLFRSIRPELDEFVERLKLLSNLDPAHLSFASTYANKIDLSVAPAGNISSGIKAIGEQVALDSEKLISTFSLIRTVLFMTVIAIMLALGFFLIFPALRSLARSLASERKLTNNLAYLASHDAMTGLMNRAGLERVMSGKDWPKNFAYAVIDLNMFKLINDSYGHAAGDAVLREYAARLKTVIPKGAAAARVGGDEFVIVDPDVSDLQGCEQLGRCLIGVFDEPATYEGRHFNVSAAIGIALASEVEEEFDAVARAADTAMFREKENGKTQYCIFNEEMAVDIPNLGRKTELASGIIHGEFRPWYQPKYSLKTGEVKGFEAVARWHHAEQGVLAPAAFLRDIDRYGLQSELTDFIIEAVLSQLNEWQENGLNVPPVAVNISANLLASEVEFRMIKKRLEQFEKVAHLLVLEITEDVFLPRISEAVKRSVKSLVDLGVRISIDDFGSGYASFRHLTEFLFHEVKIDKFFVQGIGKDKSSETILEAIVKIADGLEVKVVAEGIETQEQQRFLRELGCHIGQGYLFAKPLTAQNAKEFLPISSRRAQYA